MRESEEEDGAVVLGDDGARFEEVEVVALAVDGVVRVGEVGEVEICS